MFIIDFRPCVHNQKAHNFNPDVIRTRNLLIWSQTRYRCATESCCTHRGHNFLVNLVLRLGPVDLFNLVAFDDDFGGDQPSACQGSGPVVLILDEGVLARLGAIRLGAVEDDVSHAICQ